MSAPAFSRLRSRLAVPVIAAPMFLISGPDLVVAAARAGIVGAFAAPSARTIEELDQWCERIADEAREAQGDWAISLITHRTYPRLAEEVALVSRHRPAIVLSALGSPRDLIDAAHEYGGTVLADVTTMRHAERALAAGVDGLVLVCAGAGGHTGAYNPFAFVAAIRAEFDGPLVLAGGIADGSGVAGVIAAGADLAYVGSRFISTQESMAPDGQKQMTIEAGLEDLEASAELTGATALWLSRSLRADESPGAASAPDFGGLHGAERKRWRDVWSAGHGLVGATEASDVANVVAVLADGYASAIRRLSGPEGTA